MDKGFIIERISEIKGLGIFASRCYEEGQTVFEEEPLVSAQFAWNKQLNYSACDHCLRPLESVEENIRRLSQDASVVVPHPELCPTEKQFHSPCPSCQVMYCSDGCRLKAWNEYHRTMCQCKEPLQVLYNAWRNVHYPPETTSIELIVRLLSFVHQSPDKQSSLDNIMQFCHESVRWDEDACLKLLREEGVSRLQVLQPLISSALPFSVTSQLVTVEGLKTLFSLVGRNGQGIGTSVLAAWVERVTALSESLPVEEKSTLDDFIDSTYQAIDAVVGEFVNVEGSGLYRLQRCLNHSCIPNCEVTFPHGNHTLRLVTKRKLEPGEEMTISYLDECCLERSRHSRNKYLREHYLFDCECSRCMIDISSQPDETSEEEEADDEPMDEEM